MPPPPRPAPAPDSGSAPGVSGSAPGVSGSAPGWREFLLLWLRIGALSFGGPAGQIALMHREVVERGWLSDAQYLRALNFCLLLPGPEAQQLAAWCGWRLKGTAGGLAAGLLFVLPGALVMAALAALYLRAGEVAGVRAALHGVQAVVLALVALALWRVARRALRDRLAWALAIAAFAALFLFDAPFPLVVLAAGLIGAALGARQPGAAVAADGASWRRSVGVALAWLLVWLAPIALLALWLGAGHPLVDLAAFFARMAALTFGGAYAAMSWVAQAAVETHGWLSAREMLVGLGLAETTPGPLVLVFQFVGALAGARISGPWDGPWDAAWVGASLGMATVLWVTFAPSFLWIFALAPHLDALASRPLPARALAGIGAAVVGVMANLALWFALHLIWPHLRADWHGALRLWHADGAADATVMLLALAAFALLGPLRRSPVLVVPLGALAGYGLMALPI